MNVTGQPRSALVAESRPVDVLAATGWAMYHGLFKVRALMVPKTFGR